MLTAPALFEDLGHSLATDYRSQAAWGRLAPLTKASRGSRRRWAVSPTVQL